jgi:hypothetical protein
MDRSRRASAAASAVKFQAVVATAMYAGYARSIIGA